MLDCLTREVCEIYELSLKKVSVSASPVVERFLECAREVAKGQARTGRAKTAPARNSWAT
jgi:hypothetical protein